VCRLSIGRQAIEHCRHRRAGFCFLRIGKKVRDPLVPQPIPRSIQPGPTLRLQIDIVRLMASRAAQFTQQQPTANDEIDLVMSSEAFETSNEGRLFVRRCQQTNISENEQNAEDNPFDWCL